VRLWECEVCRPMANVLERADQRLARDLSAAERQTYLIGA
jgi:hypothetical protein